MNGENNDNNRREKDNNLRDEDSNLRDEDMGRDLLAIDLGPDRGIIRRSRGNISHPEIRGLVVMCYNGL
ncbi:unnamed protein product [Gordionus sp. m RMFG-2023]